jgi:hypothetical protein
MRIPLGFRTNRIHDMSPGCSIFSRDRRSSGSSHADAYAVSSCTTTTPAEHGAKVNPFADRALR